MHELQIAYVESLATAHSHLREGDVVGPAIENSIDGGSDVIGPQPNTNAGLTTAEDVVAYTERAKSLVPPGKVMHFIPFVMLTEDTTEKVIDECIETGIHDGKMYPKLRTTKSEKGIVRYGRMLPVVKHCGIRGMNVHGHFEHPSMTFTNRDAEYACLPIAKMFLEETNAKIFWEHGTDGRCIPHWKEMATTGRFFVTLTPQHLATTEDDTFGDVRATCKPPLKTAYDRDALVRLVEENHPWVMAGPDDAPHDIKSKHVSSGKCACGAYTSPFLPLLYAHALDRLFSNPGGFETFVNFTSRNVRNIHNLPPTSSRITLVRKPFIIPSAYKLGSWIVEPFWAGQEIKWSFVKQ